MFTKECCFKGTKTSGGTDGCSGKSESTDLGNMERMKPVEEEEVESCYSIEGPEGQAQTQSI